jgi:hypothetical protein
MAGIDQELGMREMAVMGNPQAAQQKYAQSKNLLDLLVAQKVSNDYASARNAMQAATQAPTGSIKDQLDMSNAQVTKNDIMRSMMPGVQMKAARDQQAMQRRAMGIPTQPAPNIRMADGGIVGYEDGGIIQRILDFFRRDMQPITEEQLNEADRMDLTGTFTPRMMAERNAAIDARTRAPAPRPDDRAPKAQVVSGPPTRAEKFAQMFPKAREYVNQGGGSAMGGLQYLQMIGRMQEAAKQEEAQNAANYIKMLARSQDMIDEANPANTLPPEVTLFEEGGDVEEGYIKQKSDEFVEYVKENPLEALGYASMLLPVGGGVIAGARGLAGLASRFGPRALSALQGAGRATASGARRAGQAAVSRPITQGYAGVVRNPATGRMMSVEQARRAGVPLNRQFSPARTGTTVGTAAFLADAILNGEDPAEALAGTGVTKEQYDAATAGPARPQDDATRSDKSILELLQTGPVRPEEPEEDGGFFANIDFDLLREAAAAGAGQTTTSGALAGLGRGVGAEKQRREALASEEAMEAAKIASQRYGSELDYEAAMARLGQDERESIRTAQTALIREQMGIDAAAAKEILSEIQDKDPLYYERSMQIMDEYRDQPEMAGALLNALLENRLSANMDIVANVLGRGGGLDLPDLGTDEED